MNPTTLRLRFFRLGCRRGTGILLLSVCTVFACFAALNFAAKRSVMAKNADLRAIAQRYPKYTRQRQMAIVRARQAMLHPSWRDLSFSQAVAALLKITAAKFSSASTTATVPLANFLGNLTAITAPGIDDLYLERESDCSLTLNTGTFNYTFGGTPSLSVDGATTHYDKTLHSEAQLSTTGGAFPNGCADPTMGISTRRDIYLGKTSQNLTMYAGAGYYAPNGTNALYYGTGDPVAKQVSTFVVDTSDPDVIGVAGGDLNGDGLSDPATRTSSPQTAWCC